MKVEYEALLTKHELTVNEQEKHLKKTHSALQETEHVCHERVKIIDQLETTNAELVSNSSEYCGKNVNSISSIYCRSITRIVFSQNWKDQTVILSH